MSQYNINDLTRIVIGCVMKVHQKLGPSLLESAYKRMYRLRIDQAGAMRFKEHPVPLIYEDQTGCGYRADLIVENRCFWVKCVDLLPSYSPCAGAHLSQTHRLEILVYIIVKSVSMCTTFEREEFAGSF